MRRAWATGERSKTLERLLDVSALEAPEPLFAAVALLESLPRGDYMRLRHRMKPCHLYAVLERNGLAWDTRRGEVVECELFVWHQGDAEAAQAARKVAATLLPWPE